MRTFQVTISLPILLLAATACAQVTWEENGGFERTMYPTRNRSSNEHPKILTTQIRNAYRPEQPTKQESPHPTRNQPQIDLNTKQQQGSLGHQHPALLANMKPAPEVIKPTRVADVVRGTQNTKVEMKQPAKYSTEQSNINKEPCNWEDSVMPTALPDAEGTTEDDRISGTVLTSLGGAPGK